METIPTSIKNFLSENQVASICLNDLENKPYCINCFYVFNELENTLIFKSSLGTKHETLLKASKDVAGTILPESIKVANLKGIQFTGKLPSDFVMGSMTFNGDYAKAFPMSLMLPGYFWIVKLEHIKFTDNTLGFANKTIWNR